MCSYCGCESITVVGRFMAEHVAIINAAAELRNRDTEQRERAASALADLLNPHTSAEEVGLFTVLRRQADFAEPVHRLCAEHVDLDASLTELAGGGAAVRQVEQFLSALRTHMDREENGLFPAAAIALSGADWDEVDGLTPPVG